MKFDMSKAWDDGMAMIGNNTSMIVVVAGVFFFLPNFALMLMTPETGPELALQPGNDPTAALEAVTAIYAEIGWMIALMALLQGVGTLALYALLTHSDRPTVGQAIGFGFKGLLPFIGIGILQMLVFLFAIGIPMGIAAATGSAIIVALVGLLAIVGIIYLYTKFSLSVAVVGLDKEFNPVKAMQRSWTATKGNSLRLWLFYFLLVLAFGVVSIVITLIVRLIFGLGGAQIALFGTGLVSSLLNAVFVCVFLAVIAASYRQLTGGSSQEIAETFE